MSSWLDTDIPHVHVDQVGIVHIGDFDDAELREAAQAVGEDEHRRIGATLREGMGPVEDTSAREVLGGRDVADVDRLILDSLRHPVMWGVFASLESRQRLHALEGDQEALGLMRAPLR